MPIMKLSNGRILNIPPAEFPSVQQAMYAEVCKLHPILQEHAHRCNKTSIHCFLCDLIRDTVDTKVFGSKITSGIWNKRIGE